MKMSALGLGKWSQLDRKTRGIDTETRNGIRRRDDACAHHAFQCACGQGRHLSACVVPVRCVCAAEGGGGKRKRACGKALPRLASDQRRFSSALPGV